jgi:SAM-dependent methyltransferase
VDAPEHRGYVGPAHNFDVIGARQFALLTCLLGLREHDYLLDIGCGALRGGRFFLLYLAAGHYYGIEPATRVLKAGIEEEVGQELIARRQPTFSDDSNFTLSSFGRQFDYILAQSIFTHAARWQIERCLAEAAKVMHERSVFAATVFYGDTSYTGTEWAYGGANPMKVFYRRDDLRAMAGAAGMTVEDIDWQHIPESQQSWVVFRLNRV